MKRGTYICLWGWTYLKQLYSQFIPLLLCLLASPHHQFPSLSDLSHVYSFVAATQLRALLCSLCYKLVHMEISSWRTFISLLLPVISCLPHLTLRPSHFWEVQQAQNACWCLSAWKHRQVAASINWPGHELKYYKCPSSFLVSTFPGHPSQLVPGHSGDSPGWGQQPRRNPGWKKSRERRSAAYPQGWRTGLGLSLFTTADAIFRS